MGLTSKLNFLIINGIFFIIFLSTIIVKNVECELTPPYFNLAEGRKIYSSASCGVGTDGPELYCKLVGAVGNESERLIQGQVCDYCDISIPEKNHPPDYAIDGTENWWQSPPLSRGMKYNEVNLTIDFGQEFHVAYLFLRMGNSPRPGLWTLEKSSDYGKTWTAWQHFSDTPADCETYFGKDSFKPITNNDDVICTTEYSKIVPLEGGEIPVMLLNNRPSANNYFNSTVLQEWTRATNIRIRLLRTKTLLGHLMSVARQDPTVTRRYFYSIKDISIGGRCVCNGHADTCHVLDELALTRILTCQCQHNTCGIQCAECCPGFEQKKWRQNTKARPFKCEPCNCFGHSNTCEYSEEVDAKSLSLDIHGIYEGGGVCKNCHHNTEGINCNKCKPKYYRPYGRNWNDTDVCQPCNCDYFFSTGNCNEGTGRCECRVEYLEPNCDDCSYGHFGYPKCRPCECFLNGTDGYHCEAQNGICPCKQNYAGNYCNKCAEGYYDFPNCVPCECNSIGAISNTCNQTTGQCPCNSNFAGKFCEKCKNGYYNYPLCIYSSCDNQGTIEEICDKTSGECLCKEGYGGPRCDQCLLGYYNYPDCRPCNCSIAGSAAKTCDVTGKCQCLSNFAGKQCTLCSAGNYKFPECLPCHCNGFGSDGISCNDDGQCLCKHNFDGKICNKCKESFYNFPACEECNCDPAGVIAKFAGCGSVPDGELCQCKERVTGRICNECKKSFWNLNITNAYGCEDCNCFIDGTLGTLDTCNSKSGQCACKPTVTGRSCNECKDGSFDLYGSNLFGCKDCGCDIGGSINNICDTETGQCRCHPRIDGRQCKNPYNIHYFPTLYQFQFEYEDGFNPSGGLVRYHFDSNIFPEFSKKGYAVFSTLQNEIFNEVDIFKSSVYRMVIRYVNLNPNNVIGNILITPDNPSESDQTAKVLFLPTETPQFVTIAGSKGEFPSAIVLDPGRYTISIKAQKGSLFLDYFVLLPAAYYEPSILTKQIETPCEIGQLDLCRHFKYPIIEDYYPTNEAVIINDTKTFMVTEFYTDKEHLSIIKEDHLPLITAKQKRLNYGLNITRTGNYIIVIDYVTDKNASDNNVLDVNSLDDLEQDGVTILYPCSYTTVCRQPVIDKESREKSFHFNHNELNIIQIEGDSQSHSAIKSVTAIPYDEWSIDYINPKSVCVMKNGKCVKSSFRVAPDAKRIEFEQDLDNHIAHKLPVNIYENSTKLIYINEHYPNIQIHTKVTPGRYNLILKFYQPDHPKFNINYTVETGNQIYNGKIDLRNCPSNIGCRHLITQQNGFPFFDVDGNFTLKLTNNLPKGVWLDFALLVPADQYHNELLVEETYDQSQEFIKNCGQNHFHISLNASDFCKESVFSLTADYNSGALPCGCDYTGSISFECDPFGGQCQCKQNVIGRKCDACQTGFYGFPECKPCNCPSTALCEKDTGECICPPQVIGEKCDQCIPYTFGFDQITGCESCNCHHLGVTNGNLQCDLNVGTCECRPNIVGRTCDKCSTGFYQFPECRPCLCDLRGTTPDICDQEYDTCFCKKYVQGKLCDYCADGTFNLQDLNPDGCTKCFCFGKTQKCHSAYLRAFNVSMMGHSLTINNLEITPKSIKIKKTQSLEFDINVNDTKAEVDFRLLGDEDETLVYFGLREYLLNQNNHLSAYGGYLTYTLFYTTGLFGKARFGPDIILTGRNLTFIHQSYEQPATAQLFRGAVKIVETSFTTPSGLPATRDQFMVLLRDLDAIYIRATYWEDSLISRIADVYLTMAHEDEDNYLKYEELSVEKCQCPPGYTGNSCEDCAPGYYRDPNGPFGGFCVPCQCNGHAAECDCDTGICSDCRHSTTGDHCEQCIEGYYGNATYGSPHDCMICACPIPVDSNNFATSCEISEDGYKINCNCRPGYIGPKCQSCAAGYYGRPDEIGDYCKPCSCSNNIDSLHPDSCDSVTGECLLCLNNTFGVACNLCAPGYYGDAIALKNCQSCICDNMGTEHCDSYSGTCVCQPNVIGDKCDSCELDHYGFDSGLGCKACSCGLASNSTQCDDHTGECRCKPGTHGRQCDRCLPGFWNYTRSGCVPCSCNTDYARGLGCNSQNGQCECLPGVVGEKCNSCPPRWVLIPDSGCEECDVCHHALLDVTDAMKYKIDTVIADFNSTAGGYFTLKKLDYFEELANELQPKVDLLDPLGVNLSPLSLQIDTLESLGKDLSRQMLFSNQNSKSQTNGINKLLHEANDINDESRIVSSKAQLAIRDVKKLADSLETSESSTILDAAFNEAKGILQNMNDFKIENTTTANQLNRSIILLDANEMILVPIYEQEKKLTNLKSQIGNFSDKMTDLFEWSNNVTDKLIKARIIHTKNNDSTVHSKFETVTNHAKETLDNNMKAENLIKETEKMVERIFENYKQADDVKSKLNKENEDSDKHIEGKREVYDDLSYVTEPANNHRDMLIHTANNLKKQLSNVTANSEQALKAANSYSNIVDAVNAARNAVRDAKMAAGNTTQKSVGVGELALLADQAANELLENVTKSLAHIKNELEPQINKSANQVNDIVLMNLHSDDEISAINLALEKIPDQSQTQIWETARYNAIDANEKSENILNEIKPIIKELQKDLNKTKLLPQDIGTANNNIIQATAQVDKLKNHIPEIEALYQDVDSRQSEISARASEFGDQIERLKLQINNAREIANDIKVGVKFQPNTILELKTPETLPLLASTSRVSAYFKTENVNGFLLYLGNEIKSKDKPEDFMALEIENGYPVLTVDLGNGQERIISNKYVANNQWYQVIVERYDNDVKLIIREELKDGEEQLHEVDHHLSGSHPLFNLDEKSRLFVGGYPTDDFNMQDGIKYTSFEGEIEDVKIGESEVGLWNFVDGQGIQGALERNRLMKKTIETTGYRFGGNGYVILDSRPHMFKQSSSIQFRFKASRGAKDGLMFYAGKNNSYISIEMRNGAIFFRYKLGEESFTLGIDKTFNDDQWHMVDAERNKREGQLKIDSVTVYKNEAPGTEENLQISDNMYFGGHPDKINHTEVISKSFDGCIDNVYIAGSLIDLRRHRRAYNVRAGCPSKFSAIVSFPPHEYGYAKQPNLNSYNHFQINFKFKTKQEQGVIFYTSNHDQSASVGLSINNGQLHLNAVKEYLISDLRFDDGEWHVVTVSLDSKILWLIIDEHYKYSTEYEVPSFNIVHGDIYFGGIPKNFKIPKNSISTVAYFTGCISDVTVNNAVVNFANLTDVKSASLECSRDILNYNPVNLPLYYPDGEEPYPQPIPHSTESSIWVPTHGTNKPTIEAFTPHPRPQKTTELPPLLPVETTIIPETTTTLPTQPPTRRIRTTTTTPSTTTSEAPTIPYNTHPPATAATTKAPRTRRPKDKDSICELPLEPDFDVDLEAGYRFGTVELSRVEYNMVIPSMKESYDLSLEFRTSEPDGVLFYVSDLRHNAFIALHIKDGHMHHSFNGGNGGLQSATMISKRKYNDNQWHSVQLTRIDNNGTLLVNEDDWSSVETKSVRIMNLVEPIYIGGVRNESIEDVSINLKLDKTKYFSGCIKNILYLRKEIGDKPSIHGVLPCSDSVEDGIFFGKNGGHVKLKERFKVGVEMTISLDIKPRTTTGLLLSVHGKKAYFAVQLVNGTIVFSVDNGDGVITAVFHPEPNENFCDGKWRTITVIKSKYVASIQVDALQSKPAIGNSRISSTDTSRPLFLGGHPHLQRVRGLTARKPYQGCIRNVNIQDIPEKITPKMATGHVEIGVCPTI